MILGTIISTILGCGFIVVLMAMAVMGIFKHE